MQYEEKGETLEALSISTVTEFWLSAVNIFWALYEAVFQSVYSRTDKAKFTLATGQHCVKEYYVSFPSIVLFITVSLFQEGEGGAYDFL